MSSNSNPKSKAFITTGLVWDRNEEEEASSGFMQLFVTMLSLLSIFMKLKILPWIALVGCISSLSRAPSSKLSEISYIISSLMVVFLAISMAYFGRQAQLYH